MSVSDLSGLIAAITFAVIGLFLAYAFLCLGRLFDRTGAEVGRTVDHLIEPIDESTTTLRTLNQTLADVNQITSSASNVAQDVEATVGLLTAVVKTPTKVVGEFIGGIFADLRALFTRNKSDETVADDFDEFTDLASEFGTSVKSKPGTVAKAAAKSDSSALKTAVKAVSIGADVVNFTAKHFTGSDTPPRHPADSAAISQDPTPLTER